MWNLIDGVDVLLHNARFTATERRLADDYGHATVEETIALAVKASVGTLLCSSTTPPCALTTSWTGFSISWTRRSPSS